MRSYYRCLSLNKFFRVGFAFFVGGLGLAMVALVALLFRATEPFFLIAAVFCIAALIWTGVGLFLCLTAATNAIRAFRVARAHMAYQGAEYFKQLITKNRNDPINCFLVGIKIAIAEREDNGPRT